MPRDFKCFTDAGFQLIFDPGAAKTLAALKESEWFDSLEAEVKAGHLTARAFGDGEAFFRVFLEGEAVPRSMDKRAGAAVTGLLEVPTGCICFAPFEHLARAPEQVLEVAPGRYEITLREMEWGELVEAMAERAARKASPSGSKASEVLGLITGLLVLLTGIGGIASLVAVLDSGWTAWSAAWPWLLGASAVFGLLALAWKAWPGAREALAAQQAMLDRFPTTLVILRKLGDGEGPTSGRMLDDHV